MIWNYEGFWQKSKLYAERADEVERESPLFAFWSSLMLEILARAALAFVHPALLADPSDNAGENLLYVFGYGTIKSPKSIPAKTVFGRCQKIISDFAEEDVKFCLSMADRRNAELHTGTPVFEDLPTGLWLANYYRICDLLLTAQNKTLEDLFGRKIAAAARTMMDALKAELISEAKKRVGQAKDAFEKLTEDEQTDRLTRAAGLLKAAEYSAGFATNGVKPEKHVKCPACGSTAKISGEPIYSGEPRFQDDLLYREIVVLPTRFECKSCGLVLEGHGMLHAAELGGQFGVTEVEDPVQRYAEEFDPADYYEEDYGNC